MAGPQPHPWHDWYADLARDYADLEQRCDVIFTMGMSMGGLLATKIALEHPEVRESSWSTRSSSTTIRCLPILPVLRHIIPFFPGIAGDIKKEGVTELAYDRNPLHSMYSLTPAVEDRRRAAAQAAPSRSCSTVPASTRWSHGQRRVLPVAQATNAEVTEVWLENSYHVATLDNDAPQIFEGSVEFIERLRA